MQLSAGEKIKVILMRRNMSLTDLAKGMGTSIANISNKLSRDNFSEKELQKIAEVTDCTFDAAFTLNDTGETI